MEQRIDELCRLVGSLSIDMNRGSILKEILNIVLTVRKETLRRTELEQQIPRLFDCLNTSDDGEVRLVCAILKKILPDMNPEATLVRCMQCILRALNHPMNDVRCIAMDVLLNASDREHLLPVVSDQRVVLNAIMCLFTYDLHLTQQATEFVVKISKVPGVLKFVLGGQSLQYMETYRTMKSEYAFRIYEVIVGISLVSEENFLQISTSGLFAELLSELKQQDPLLKLNALDLIGRIAETQYGFDFLESESIVTNLCTKFRSLPATPLCGVLTPGFVKFLGVLAHAHPVEMVNYHPGIFDYIVTSIVTGGCDALSLALLLEMIAFIGSSPDGKKALNSMGDSMYTLMSNFQEYLRYLPTELKVRAIIAFGDMIRLQPRDQTEELLYITCTWFGRMSSTPLDAVVPYCCQPFPDLQLVGLRFVQALAEQPWGVQQINKYIGLMEFLLDRQRASNKECREAKYEIINALLKSPIAESEFNPHTLAQMKEFVKQGPFFAESLMEVAVEEAGN